MKLRLMLLFPLLVLLHTAFAAGEITAPADFLGHEVGADRHLADWNQILTYFDRLDRQSDRVLLDTLGTSTRGRPFIMAIVSSAANLKRVDHLKVVLSRLADPRRIDPDSAAVLIAEARPAVLIGCAQHATEIGSTQMSLKLAYRLATATDGDLRKVLDDVILLLIPSLNPDGHQMVTEWYRSQVGTPYEGGRMPWLYHPYVGHDINRDWFMQTQVETRLVSQVMYYEWFPQAVLDMHQMGQNGARLFVPPPADPVNPNYDPLLNRLIALIGAELGLAHTRAGQTGVITHAIFDAWWPGYFNAVPYTHNAVSLISEAASCNLASPVFLRRSELRGRRPGMSSYDVLTNFPDPWPGGWWRLGDIVDYELVMTEMLLKHMARERELYLSLFYDLGRRQIESGTNEPPFAFIIPVQADMARAWELAGTLRAGGVEVLRAESSFTADGIEYRAGSLVVPMSQPFRSYAKDLLEIQNYPDRRLYPGGPPESPYDAAGWTIPLAMDVKTVQVMNFFEFDGRLMSEDDGPESGIDGRRAGAYIIDCRANNSYRLVNRALAQGCRVWRVVAPIPSAGSDLPHGGFIVEPGKADKEFESWLHELGLAATATDPPEPGRAGRLRPVRLGVYQPWTASMDEGWLRWVLERFEFPYRTVHNAEVRAGNLGERFDVIILPDMAPSAIDSGAAEGELPPKFVGGLGRSGGFALRDLVRSGGTLIAVNRSSEWAIDWFDPPIENVLEIDEQASEEEKKKQFHCPGSLLRLELRAELEDPLLYGYGDALPILYHGGPVFEIIEEEEAEKAAGEVSSVRLPGRYPASNPLLSGWIQNPEVIGGRAALATMQVGRGRVVLFGFTPYRRAQTHGTFRLLFNAFYLGR